MQLLCGAAAELQGFLKKNTLSQKEKNPIKK